MLYEGGAALVYSVLAEYAPGPDQCTFFHFRLSPFVDKQVSFPDMVANACPNQILRWACTISIVLSVLIVLFFLCSFCFFLALAFCPSPTSCCLSTRLLVFSSKEKRPYSSILTSYSRLWLASVILGLS